MIKLDIRYVKNTVWWYSFNDTYSFREDVVAWFEQHLNYIPEIISTGEFSIAQNAEALFALFETDTDALLFKIAFADRWQ